MLQDSWRLAVGTLTAISIRPPANVDRSRAMIAIAAAPLAVVPLGAALVAVACVGHWLGLPIPVVALLGLGTTVLGNRAFHLDGLSDTVDGLAASYDRERSLAVMKTGTSGPAGVVAVVLVLGLQATGLASLLATQPWWRAAVLAGVVLCVSRAALTVCCMRGVPPARPDGLGLTFTQTISRPLAVAVWLVAAAVVAGVCGWAGVDWWRGLMAVGVAALVAVVVVVVAVRRFGGVTGDVFGASIELAFAGLLVALA